MSMFKFAATFVVATAVMTVSGPALAAGKQNAKVIERNGKTLYCVSEKISSSRMPNQTCLTKEEWEARGSQVASAIDKAEVLASNPQPANQN
jgi:hypothetical protein